MSDSEEKSEEKIKDANDAAKGMSEEDFKKATRRLADEAQAPRVILVEKKDVKDETAGWNDFENWGQADERKIRDPKFLIDKMLMDRSKAQVAAPSKARKTYFAMHAAVCICSGVDFLGRKVKRGRVLYVNFELRDWTWRSRFRKIAKGLGVRIGDDDLVIWDFKNKKAPVEAFKTKLLQKAKPGDFELIIIDPLYKLFSGSGFNESDPKHAGIVYDCLNDIQVGLDCSILVMHHFAKGNSAHKSSIDRGSGSGYGGRDFDFIASLTPHDVEDCFTLSIDAREVKRPPEVVLRWDDEDTIYKIDETLDPEDLQQPGKKQSRAGDTDSPEHKASSLQTYIPRNGNWHSKLTLIGEVKKKLGLSEVKARALIDEFMSINGLYDLTSEDGEKKKDGFSVRIRQGAIQFKAH